MEFYCAFFDVNDVMDLTEEMISGLVKSVTGSYTTKYHSQDGTEHTINWEAPWPRIDMIPALEEATNTKFPPADQFHTEESLEFFKSLLQKIGLDCSPPLTTSRMIDKMVGGEHSTIHLAPLQHVPGQESFYQSPLVSLIN
jgi:lysyl-tRNA synthetase class 2